MNKKEHEVTTKLIAAIAESCSAPLKEATKMYAFLTEKKLLGEYFDWEMKQKKDK